MGMEPQEVNPGALKWFFGKTDKGIPQPNWSSDYEAVAHYQNLMARFANVFGGNEPWVKGFLEGFQIQDWLFTNGPEPDIKEGPLFLIDFDDESEVIKVAAKRAWNKAYERWKGGK